MLNAVQPTAGMKQFPHKQTNGVPTLLTKQYHGNQFVKSVQETVSLCVSIPHGQPTVCAKTVLHFTKTTFFLKNC